MDVKIKLVGNDAKLPKRMSPTDAGMDLFSPEDIELNQYETHMLDFGFQMELPKGTVGLLFARSGIGSKSGIVPRNCVGVIDEKYRGNVKMMVKNDSTNFFKIRKGDRIAQMVILPVYTPTILQADELDCEGDRGGGFNSTGR